MTEVKSPDMWIDMPLLRVAIKRRQGIGLGLYATKSIRAGAVLFHEKAAAVAPAVSSEGVTLVDHVDLATQAVKTMNPTLWALLEPRAGIGLDLTPALEPLLDKAFAESKCKMSLTDFTRNLAKVQRNHYVGEDGQRSVFPIGSLFNHSCAPNVVYGITTVALTEGKNKKLQIHGDVETLPTIRFYAKSDIAAGEELCISYHALHDLPRSQRHAKLGFVCRCPVCLKTDKAPGFNLDSSIFAKGVQLGDDAGAVVLQHYLNAIKAKLVSDKAKTKKKKQQATKQATADADHDGFEFAFDSKPYVSPVKRKLADEQLVAWQARVAALPDSDPEKATAVTALRQLAAVHAFLASQQPQQQGKS